MLSLLHRSIDRAAERAPDDEAIRFGGSVLTYGELADRSSRLARVLRERGVSRGDRVGILARKGIESATAIYGIMKAGAAYVPLDTSAPIDRLVLIAKDCGIEHLVSEPAKSDAARAMMAAGVPLRSAIGCHARESTNVPGIAWDEVFAAPLAAAVPDANELDLAYVLYTSGSTGVPKGVVHTHRSALAFAQVAAQTYGLRPGDRVTNHAPLHFDLSTLDYFATAVAGATTVVIPEIYTKLPASLSKLLEDERVSVVYAVPSALAQLAMYGALQDRNLTHIRWVLFGGEPFPPKHLRELMRALPNAQVSNVYGPTEVNGVTYWVVPPVAEDDDAPIPIGRAFDNVDLLVINEHGDRAATGAAGELWVRSPTMMQGYWGRPDLDEGAFAFRPDEGAQETVFHKTGDLVREDTNGVLHFLGRKDRQIKSRGHRVELDEVESVLMTHVGVEAAAVYAVPDAQGNIAIEASVVLLPASSTTVAELTQHAARALPPYALPQRLEIAKSLPRTATDKIDRVALRARALNRRADANQDTA